ncbi:MAG: hypothetical protein O4804_15550 [Trichodesmium sp. St11_bin5]|nr:hypothetical protein [Trichodesmium sp. St11_bin5]
MNIVPQPYKLLWSVLYVVIINPISIEKLLLDPNSTIVANLDKLSLKLLILYTIVCKLIPEKIPIVLQAHVEGSSLREIICTVKLAYNIVISLVSSSFSKRTNTS